MSLPMHFRFICLWLSVAMGFALALGQGTFECNNDYIPGGWSERPLIVTMDPLMGRVALPRATGRVEVLDGKGNILSPEKDGTGDLLVADGLFDLGIIAVTNFPLFGRDPIVVIRAWIPSELGPSYADASTRGEAIVQFYDGFRGPPGPPTSLAKDSSFTGLLCGPRGGTVDISNGFIPQGRSTKAFITYGGALVSTNVGRVEVLDGTGTIISSVKDGTGNPLFADGLFSLGVIEIPGTIPGGNGSIVIRAWDASTGTMYASAINKGFRIATLSGLGGDSQPPASLAKNSTFTGFDIFPWWSPWTGPPPPPPARDVTIVQLQDGRWRIRATGGGNSYFLYSSTDLTHWRSEGERLSSGQQPDLEWIVPAPGPTVGFFQIVP